MRKLDVDRMDRAALASVADTAPRHRTLVSARDGRPGAFAFEERAVVAAAGRVSVTLRNPTGVFHNVMVLDSSKPGPKPPPFLGHQPILPSTSSNRFSTDTLTVNLKPGSYRLVCIVSGHAANGMSIPLKVVDDPQATDTSLPSSAERIADHLPANNVTLTRRSAAPEWDKKEASVRAGRVRVRLINRSPVGTDIAVINSDGGILTPDSPIMAEGRGGFLIDLAPGEYALANLPEAKKMTIPLHVR